MVLKIGSSGFLINVPRNAPCYIPVYSYFSDLGKLRILTFWTWLCLLNSKISFQFGLGFNFRSRPNRFYGSYIKPMLHKTVPNIFILRWFWRGSISLAYYNTQSHTAEAWTSLKVKCGCCILIYHLGQRLAITWYDPIGTRT